MYFFFFSFVLFCFSFILCLSLFDLLLYILFLCLSSVFYFTSLYFTVFFLQLPFWYCILVSLNHFLVIPSSLHFFFLSHLNSITIFHLHFTLRPHFFLCFFFFLFLPYFFFFLVLQRLVRSWLRTSIFMNKNKYLLCLKSILQKIFFS